MTTLLTKMAFVRFLVHNNGGGSDGGGADRAATTATAALPQPKWICRAPKSQQNCWLVPNQNAKQPCARLAAQPEGPGSPFQLDAAQLSSDLGPSPPEFEQGIFTYLFQMHIFPTNIEQYRNLICKTQMSSSQISVFASLRYQFSPTTNFAEPVFRKITNSQNLHIFNVFASRPDANQKLFEL